MKKIYVDNSSTSFPKAKGLSGAVKGFLDEGCYNLARGTYADAYQISRIVLETRQLLADFFHIRKPQEVIFTPGLTYSLNMLLQGFLKAGDHVITSSMEHNAVMRPLNLLSKKGISYDKAPCNEKGFLEVGKIPALIKANTKAIVILHASNVCGSIMPLEMLAALCKQHKLRLIVDAAQSAGTLDIDAKTIDALAFAGHKGLLGPQGIGGFVIKTDFARELEPLIVGGTGSLSDKIEQPVCLPDKFESGTLNLPAIVGLKCALEHLRTTGLETIYCKELLLTREFIRGINTIDGVALIGEKGSSPGSRVAVVSLDFLHFDNARVAFLLDHFYGIMTRCGLHCAASAHKTLGTYPHGTVRFSFGYYNTTDEIAYIVRAIKQIVKKGPNYEGSDYGL